MTNFKFPTEEIELPSKGLIYPKENPLSSGVVEMKYMTAKEEDILTNQNYIQNGTVLDRLLKSLIVDKKISIEDLIIGDKNALLISTRILGYGSEYTFDFGGKQQTVDLTQLNSKPIDESMYEQGINEFEYHIESTDTTIQYRLLTGRDEKIINQEIEGIRKITPQASPELTTRLKRMIISVNGEKSKKSINDFVDNYFLARDSRAFREHIKNTQPDVDLNITLEGGKEVLIPIGIGFFWPDFN